MTTITLAISASHRENHKPPGFRPPRSPANDKLPTHKAGPIIVLNTAPNAVNRRRLEGRSKVALPRANLRTSQAPATASVVLPRAVPAEAATSAGQPAWPVTGPVALSRNAPRATPGQARQPSSSIAPRAKPAGGHSGQAGVQPGPKASPSLADKTYATANPATVNSLNFITNE